MVRLAVLVCAALVVAVAMWFLFSIGDAAPAMSADANGAQQTSPTPSAAPIPTAPVDASTAERARVEVEVPVAVATAEPPIPNDAVWIDVFVVDDKTKQPVTGADAVWGDQTQWDLARKLPPAARDLLFRDREAMFARYGWHGRSDRDGKLRIHLGRSQTEVLARAGTRYSSGSFYAGRAVPPEGHRLLLQEDLTVRVHVLDAAGRAAVGVPVSLDRWSSDGKPAERIFGRRTQTDGEGMFAFTHVQTLQLWSSGEQRGAPVKQWGLGVGILGLGVDPVLIEAQAPPVAPIELRLPPTGRFKARITLEGRPLPGIDELSFYSGPRDNDEVNNGDWSTRIDADGWARFGYVPLGKTLIVQSRSAGGSWDFEVAGPTAPEQEVTAVFELADAVVTLVGRLLDADGKRVVSESVTGDFNTTFMGGSVRLATDEQGQFVWPIYRPRPDNKRELKLDRLTLERRPEGAPPQRVSVPSRDLVVGRNDLGDLQFTVGSLVVGGRLVFDSPGVARAWFQIERQSQRQPVGQTVRWEQVEGLQVNLQDDGSFQVRGTVEPGSFRLHFTDKGHLPVDPVEFAVGTADLRIDLKRGVPFEVECRLPVGIVANDVRLRMQPVAAVSSSEAANEREWGSSRQDPRLGWPRGGVGEAEKFTWPALAAGSYTLLVQVPGLAEPLLSIADVVLPSPEGGDARLHALDLRDVIGTLRVSVAAAQGQLRGASVLFFMPQSEDGAWQGIQLRGGETLLPVPKRPVDLLIASYGLRSTTVRGAFDKVDVALEPWPTVAMHFVGLEALPEDIIVRTWARDAAGGKPGRYLMENGAGPRDSLLSPSGSVVVGKDGVASLPVGDGTMHLTVYLSLGERGPGTELKQFTPNQIVAGAPVTVQLDAAELQAAITALREQAAKK